MIVLLLTQILLEALGAAHVVDDILLDGELGALVSGITLVALLDHKSRGAQAVEGEQVVHDVVVETFLVEEDVVFLGHV